MSKLVYSRPARNWYESLPVGNGKTAFTLSGGKRVEKLWFNDSELWSGYPQNHDDPEAFKALGKARALIAENRNSEAESIVRKDMDGNYSEAFMPLATVKLTIGASGKGEYKRTVLLDQGMVEINDGATVRKAFVSYPHKVAVYSIESGSVFSLKISATSKLRHCVSVNDRILTVSGNAPDYAAPNYLRHIIFPIRYNKGNAEAYCLALRAETDGVQKESGKGLNIKDATYVRIYAVTHTGFKGYDVFPDNDTDRVRGQAVEMLKGVNASYEQIEREHIEDFSAIYGRQKLTLKQGDGNVENLVKEAREGRTSAELINLLYDFGKYMTVCGSRSSQPLNLQGQWNKSVRPPWSSNLTTNINAEMNYWGASRAGLEECLAPFYKKVAETVERGKKTAAVNYGARGFCCNHNLDIWRNTSPVQGDPCYMYSPFCGAWLANEVFAHKKNCGKKDEEATYIISEAAKFCLDYLTEYKGSLVTSPSTSPETAYSENGRRVAVGMASAYEMSVIRQTFTFCLESDAEERLKTEVRDALGKLRPYEKADNGLAEWAEGKTSVEKGHRHFSPLYGVYPGNVVKEGSPEFEWARELFAYRLKYASSAIGWSAAWAICLAGRFKDKATAKKVVESFTSRSIMNNLFDFHPPCYFQIDGNMGFIAGINELLLSEADGVVTLLPACFDTIENGEMSGAVVNGAKLSFRWKKGKVVEVSSDKKIKIKDLNVADGVILKNVEKV